MDWDAAAADLAVVRADNTETMTIRRNSVTLPGQAVRVARLTSVGAIANGGAGALEASIGRVLVVGAPTLDVQPGDRFTVGVNLYEAVLVRPNRRASTQVEAKMVQ